MNTKQIQELALSLGATAAQPVDPQEITFHQELRGMCAMNRCGKYGTNWGCPPGCGEMDALANAVRSFSRGVVYQLVGRLEDSFDFEGMMASEKIFYQMTRGLREALAKENLPSLVLGAGTCRECEKCTYPQEPCRFPDKKHTSVEACGIYVTKLCEAAGLSYINGENTLTNTGLILF